MPVSADVLLDIDEVSVTNVSGSVQLTFLNPNLINGSYEVSEVISNFSLEISVSSSTFTRLFERARSDDLPQFL
jgi:hypothetical protein